MSPFSAIINTTRYPILDLATLEAHSVISACQAQLAQDGLCLLPNFILPAALTAMLDEARLLAPAAHRTEHWRASANGGKNDQNSRLSRQTRASVGAVAYDQISPKSPLRQLYEWDGLTAFISAVFKHEALYRTADPLVNCMLTVLHQRGYSYELYHIKTA